MFKFLLFDFLFHDLNYKTIKRSYVTTTYQQDKYTSWQQQQQQQCHHNININNNNNDYNINNNNNNNTNHNPTTTITSTIIKIIRTMLQQQCYNNSVATTTWQEYKTKTTPQPTKTTMKEHKVRL